MALGTLAGLIVTSLVPVSVQTFILVGALVVSAGLGFYTRITKNLRLLNPILFIAFFLIGCVLAISFGG
jgi:hypothetical protein